MILHLANELGEGSFGDKAQVFTQDISGKSSRFLRINIAALSVYIALGAAAYFCFGKNYKLVYAYFAAFGVLLPLILAVSVLLNLPTDRVEYAFFVRRANRLIDRQFLFVKRPGIA